MHFPINVILEDIRSALNVGSIFRTCDSCGIETLFLTGITPYPPHNRIPKTALGAIESVKWVHNKNTTEVINTQKQKGDNIYSIEICEGAEDIYETNIQFPASIILGNEISGVSKEATELSKKTLYIPMYGKKESLNVAVTTGIILYELIRKYKYK